MIGTLRDIAIAASTAVVLTGSAAQSQDIPAGATIDSLNLPMGEEPAIYFNASTQTVITEQCYDDTQHDNTVVCDMRVLANAAIMTFEQQMIYTVDGKGNLLVTPGIASPDKWSTEFDGGAYKNLKEQATIAEWSATSPLAETDSNGIVIQNDTRRAELVGDRAHAWSYAPITEDRGIYLTQAFEDKADATFQFTMLVNAGGGTVLSAESHLASRPFVEGDYNFVERYYNDSFAPSYTME